MEIPTEVYVRARPTKQAEQNSKRCITTTGNQINLKDKNNLSTDYAYDAVFDENAEQNDVYNTAIRRQVDRMFEGYDVIIFAYEQTGSGKTFTMGTAGGVGENENVGIIPRVFADLFDRIKSTEAINLPSFHLYV